MNNKKDLSQSRAEKKKYDEACKRILSERIILAWILRECVAEFAGMEVKEIAGKYIENVQVSDSPVHQDSGDPSRINGLSNVDASRTEGTVTYDIRFHAYAPVLAERIRLIVNLEAQSKYNTGYPLTKRAVYYCGRMISSQYGTEFTKSHYEKLKKVYSIWICVNVPRKRQNTITRYVLEKNSLIGYVEEKKCNYDLIAIIMICLGREEEPETRLLKLLNTLFSDKKEAEEKQRILRDEFDIQMTDDIKEEVAEMCNLSEGIWEDGMKQGVKKGIEAANERTAKRLFLRGSNAEEIAEICEVPVETVHGWLQTV